MIIPRRACTSEPGVAQRTPGTGERRGRLFVSTNPDGVPHGRGNPVGVRWTRVRALLSVARDLRPRVRFATLIGEKFKGTRSLENWGSPSTIVGLGHKPALLRRSFPM